MIFYIKCLVLGNEGKRLKEDRDFFILFFSNRFDEYLKQNAFYQTISDIGCGALTEK